MDPFKRLFDDVEPRGGMVAASPEGRLVIIAQALPGGRRALARGWRSRELVEFSLSSEWRALANDESEYCSLPSLGRPGYQAVGMALECLGIVWRVVEDCQAFLIVNDADGRVEYAHPNTNDIKVLWTPSQPAEDFVFMRPCGCCGKPQHVDALTPVEGGQEACKDCLEDRFERCVQCGDYVPKGGLSPDGLCAGCHRAARYVCHGCGEEFLRGDQFRYGVDLFCPGCRDELFTACEACGDVVCNEDAHYDDASDRYLCPSCAMQRSDCVREHGYGHDAGFDTVFHGDDSGMFYGIELEMECPSGDVGYVAGQIEDPTETDWHLEEDASLRNGIEVVSQPRTFKSWQGFWSAYDRRVLAPARRSGCTAHDNGRCGLHVHSSLSEWSGGQLLRLFSLLYDPDNYRKLLKVSQRAEDQLEQWASLRIDDIGSIEAKHKIRGKESPFYTRYAALNITEKTLEVRLFRSSLRLDRVKRCLEFVHALYRYTDEAKRATWKGLMLWTRRHKRAFPSLFSHLEEIGLIEKKRRPRAVADARRKACAL
jgi:hypothetical protein